MDGIYLYLIHVLKFAEWRLLFNYGQKSYEKILSTHTIGFHLYPVSLGGPAVGANIRFRIDYAC